MSWSSKFSDKMAGENWAALVGRLMGLGGGHYSFRQNKAPIRPVECESREDVETPSAEMASRRSGGGVDPGNDDEDDDECSSETRKECLGRPSSCRRGEQN
ncbi:hypothetical protein J6590_056002 [Homalodisca vitripennis]|nr:hypothetical protein J6590_056002 [Homalodisca vitripennis]